MNLFNRSIDLGGGSKLALNWRVLGLLNLYRVLVPLVLLGLYSLGGSRGIAVDDPPLFFGVALLYLCFGLGSVVLVRKRLATPHFQAILQASVDITCLMLLLHACGGIGSGLGPLLLVPVGGLAFLLPPRSALFLAAVAALAVLLHTIWQQLTGRADITAYATAGFLGAVLFTFAASASVVASRMHESEDLIRQKDVDLANLAELSQYIVQHLRESLLVVDAADRIRLINESAAEILGDSFAVPGALVGEVSPRLLYSLSTWRQGDPQDSAPSTFVGDARGQAAKGGELALLYALGHQGRILEEDQRRARRAAAQRREMRLNQARAVGGHESRGCAILSIALAPGAQRVEKARRHLTHQRAGDRIGVAENLRRGLVDQTNPVRGVDHQQALAQVLH
ncbi:MAG: hypothetical protein ACLPQI_18125, partial [Steroidobacteraceae bacterium]